MKTLKEGLQMEDSMLAFKTTSLWPQKKSYTLW